jgi:nitrous oxide reductase accessory protein NosL
MGTPARTYIEVSMAAVLFLFLALVSHAPADAAEGAPGKGSGKEKCPVCGMFVAKFPDFAAAVRFRDGSVVRFDGAKDLFRYWLDVKKYHPLKNASDIVSVHVTDYYLLEYVDGRRAFYVAGSNVYGPMGKELIPFGKEDDAREFMVDHTGKSLLRFDEVDAAVLGTLD